jgi:hypothetical protein
MMPYDGSVVPYLEGGTLPPASTGMPSTMPSDTPTTTPLRDPEPAPAE